MVNLRDIETTVATHTRVRASLPPVRAYALVTAGSEQAVDVFLRPEDANRALVDAVRDQPEWRDLLSVVPIELVNRSLRVLWAKSAVTPPSHQDGRDEQYEKRRPNGDGHPGADRMSLESGQPR
jgi:hypothetical protein